MIPESTDEGQEPFAFKVIPATLNISDALATRYMLLSVSARNESALPCGTKLPAMTLMCPCGDPSHVLFEITHRHSAPASAADKERETVRGNDGREWNRQRSVDCVECPDCGFTFDAAHRDEDGTYSCPNCLAPAPTQQVDNDDSPGEICVANYDEWRAFQAWRRSHA